MNSPPQAGTTCWFFRNGDKTQIKDALNEVFDRRFDCVKGLIRGASAGRSGMAG